MIRSVRLLLLLSFCSLLFPASHKTRTHPKKRVVHQPKGPLSTIHDVGVVNVIAGTVSEHQDVAIRGDRIDSIRPAAKREKRVRYIMPGLWDMHVHLWYPDHQFPLYFANGVTGVRNMGSDLPTVRRWEQAIAKGELEGPRIFTSGAAISTQPEPKDSKLPVLVVHSPADARAAFDTFYRQQVNFIKIIDMPEPAFEALAEASRHDGVPFAGHLPDSVSAFTAAQDRMSSMEHLFGIAIACSSKETELRNERMLARERKDWEAAAKVGLKILDTYDRDRARKLFDEFRRFNVRQTPTLTLWSRMNFVDADRWQSDPAMRNVSQSIRKGWSDPMEDLKQMTPGEQKLLQKQYDFAFQLTNEMSKAGVPILAGTDTGDPWTVPGVELHKELELLVLAGLTPAQALRTATAEPAALMRKSDELGQVRPGFAADLLVLSDNPLKDIRNTRKVQAVYVRGKTVKLPAPSP